MKDKITELKIKENQNEIISLLMSTGRSGIERVLLYLDSCGFYTAPSSVGGHHNWKGGLAQHSLGVYREAVKANGGVSTPSIIIAALLHDVCKGRKFYVDAIGRIKTHHLHIHGHGYRSYVLLKNQGLNLSGEERRAIQYHMGSHDGKRFKESGFRLAYKERLYHLVHNADHANAGAGN